MGLEKTPEKVAMVAAHTKDLIAAGGQGMRTVYIPRPDEEWDSDLTVQHAKLKSEGGKMDLVVRSFTELAEILAKSRKIEGSKNN
jgi:FMN phosphatase YigB (HAD superfamily)